LPDGNVLFLSQGEYFMENIQESTPVQETDVKVKRLLKPRRRTLNLLLKLFRAGAIDDNLLEALIGMPSRDVEIILNKYAGGDLQEELSAFVEKFFSFEAGVVAPIDTAYKTYFDFYYFDDDSVKIGDAMSRHKFTRWILNNYCGLTEEKVARVEGKTARCFTGVRIRSLAELVVE
jgi:hypothetical protein